MSFSSDFPLKKVPEGSLVYPISKLSGLGANITP